MTLDDLQVLVRDQDEFRKAFRKTNSEQQRGKRLGAQDIIENAGVKNEVVELLSGNFRQGRTPFIHQVTLPDGSQVRLKFYDVVKEILNTKGKPVPGKESFLSYLEVSVAPTGMKGYYFTADVKQIVWGTSKSNAATKHQKNIDALRAQAEELKIDMSAPGAWATVYTENY